MYFAICLMLMGLAASADQPKITDEQRAAYWRARTEVAETRALAEQANARLTTIIHQMERTCGTAKVVADAKGEPMCAQPEPPKN